MSARVLPLDAAVLALAALAGCSLAGLSDDIVQGRCRVNADCDELNDESVLDTDACMRWQCDEASQLCAFGLLDDDRDQQSPASVEHDGKTFMCESDPALQDCDDGDANRAAGADEACDGADNDCDGRTDEGALRPAATRTVLFAGDSQVANQAAYALDAMGGAFAIGYSLEENAARIPGLSVLAPGLSGGGDLAQPVQLSGEVPKGEQVAVTVVQGRFAYAFMNLDGYPRLSAGLASAKGELSVEPALAAAGVSCLADEDCSSSAEEPPRIVSPVMASAAQYVLLAYLRWDGRDQTQEQLRCGGLIGARVQPQLLANLLELRKGTLEERSSQALALGASADLAPPAIAALGALGGDGDSSDFLLARVNGTGRAVIDRVQVVAGALEVTQHEWLALGAADQSHSGVALALAPVDAGEQILAVAYQRGCDAAGRVVVSLYRLRERDGELTSAAIAEEVLVGDTPRAGTPALAYSSEHRAFAVVYRDADGLRARLIGEEGVLYARDAQPYTLIARVTGAGARAVEVQLAPAAIALAGGDWFAAVAHVKRSAESETPRAFEVVRLGCGE